MRYYYRPIVQTDRLRPAAAKPIAGGWTWFDRAERISREGVRDIIDINHIPDHVVQAIAASRPPMAGLSFDAPRIMGILNLTPDSFSDGGKFNAPDQALSRASAMVTEGADILDIGGESTRPGAEIVAVEDEIQRTAPIITAIRACESVPISIDTRKAAVASAALKAGANLVNDVAAFTHDPNLVRITAQAQAPVCLMHAQGDPKTMQADPTYDDVLLDVYDYLEARIDIVVAAGISRNRILVDPGIGFGKTQAHNLTLLQGISLFHALGCPILLGASRKRFIGDISGAISAEDRASGSLAVAMAAVIQGVQLLRVHDIRETKQALCLTWAIVTH